MITNATSARVAASGRLSGRPPPPLVQHAHDAGPADDDDIDDLLSETGDITNRSSGKTGTNTEAEPDKDKPAAPKQGDA